MTTSTLHTPLEELLFFQSLRTDGISAESFTKISDTLKSNDFIHSNETYDPERLSPGNLQLLYLRLLKDEVRSNGQASPKQETEQNSKKRKLSTPPLQSIDEAAQHTHLLPRLIDRLYARYQSHMVEAIKEEERLYNNLRKEIDAIERGEWDTQLQAEDTARRDAQKNVLQDILQAETKKADALDSREQAAGTSMAQDISANSQRSERSVSTKPPQEQQPPAQTNSQLPKPVANSPVPYSPRSDGIQQSQRPISQTAVSSHGVKSPPPAQDAQLLTSHANQQFEKPGDSPAPLKPAVIPMKAAGSPISPLENLSEQSTRAQQPATTQQTPRQQGQLPNLPPHPNANPQARELNQQKHSYYVQPRYQQYPPYGQPPSGYAANLTQGLPPYPTPTHPGYPGTYPPQSGQYNLQSPYGPFPGLVTGQQPPRHTNHPHPQQGISTPVQSAAARRAQNLTPINTTVSSTKWKSTPRATKGAPKSPEPPDLSPYLPSSPSPSPEPETVKAQASNKQEDKRKEGPSRVESTPTRGRGRGRWGGNASRGRGGRGSSSTHEAKEEPMRSQSVASHTDEYPMETRRSFKNELPSTPLPVTDDTSAISTPGSTARPGRRNTLRGLELARPGTKRKRANTLEGSPENAVPPNSHFPVRPGHILASRNFPRVTNPLMNDIMSHKLASIFAKPITDRDVPGYQSLIYRPQDLKSIRLAISQGSRYIANTTTTTESVTASADESGAAATPPALAPGAGGIGKSATLWVERGPDVEPPRGIVNSAQLEKEITRIFANAVMFNPDPDRGFGSLLPRSRASHHEDEEDDDSVEGHYEVDDGGAFTRDAREMFEEVESSVGRWRSVERVEPGTEMRTRGGDGREDSEVDETADEEPEGTRGKRGRA